MTNRDLTRRGFVKNSALAVTTLPLASTRPESAPAILKIVCVGAHPDDPESGCGGTLGRYAALGHAVTIIYLTRGERGIEGKSLDEAARIRTAECETACRIIGAKPVFFGQIDGATEVTRAHVTQDGQGIWREHHEVMAQWRGREVGVPAAEAFVHLNRDQTGDLPGL